MAQHELQTRPKGDQIKAEMAGRLRQETTMALDRGKSGDGKLDGRSLPSCVKTQRQTMSGTSKVATVGIAPL
jgi:hypothetical protein